MKVKAIGGAAALSLGWLGVGLAVLAAPIDSARVGDQRPGKSPVVIAERGAAAPVPGNSAALVRFEREEGLGWVTVDVSATRDGVPVLYRDSEHLQTHSRLTGPVRVHDWAELEGLDIGAAFAPRFAGEKLLSLEEFLVLLGPGQAACLRCLGVDGADLARRIRASGRVSAVLVAGPRELLREVRRAGEGEIAILAPWPGDEAGQQELVAARPDAIEVDAPALSQELCRRLLENGIKVAARAVGEDAGPVQWRDAAAAGADWLVADRPEEVVAERVWRGIKEERGRSRPKLCLHRGAARYTPENTLAAIDKSIRLGADFVELDIRTTQDGQFFVMHDAKVDRTTDGTGPIARLLADEVKRLDAGSWFGKPFGGLAVPRFEDGIQRARERLALYIDAKRIEAPALARLLAEYRIVDTAVVYQGPAYLAELKRLQPRARTLAPLPTTAGLEALGRSLMPYAVDASWRILSKELVERCHAMGILVFSDAPDEAPAAEYRRAMDWGIDLIQTDRPLEYFRALLPGAAVKP